MARTWPGTIGGIKAGETCRGWPSGLPHGVGPPDVVGFARMALDETCPLPKPTVTQFVRDRVGVLGALVEAEGDNALGAGLDHIAVDHTGRWPVANLRGDVPHELVQVLTGCE